jgi:hypothetical protein
MRLLEVPAERVGTVPLAEVSALAVGLDRQGRPTLVAFGDRSATIAWAAVDPGLDRLDWQTLALGDSHGTRIPSHDAQVEAIAVDGDLGVLVVQEQPNRAELIDARHREVRAHIALDVGEDDDLADIRESWQDPDGSHAEGVVLLRDGHLLIVKEKHPTALIEFGPADHASGGFGPDRWLADGEAWERPGQEAVLSALAAWRPDADLSEACRDLSDAAVGPAGALLLLSDKGESVAVVEPHRPASRPFRGTVTGSTVFRVDGLRRKPEGLAVLPGGDVLIACDRRKIKGNLYLVRRETWADVV